MKFISLKMQQNRVNVIKALPLIDFVYTIHILYIGFFSFFRWKTNYFFFFQYTFNTFNIFAAWSNVNFHIWAIACWQCVFWQQQQQRKKKKSGKYFILTINLTLNHNATEKWHTNHVMILNTIIWFLFVFQWNCSFYSSNSKKFITQTIIKKSPY